MVKNICREDEEFYIKELHKNKKTFINLIDEIIDVIEKDGLPYNNKTSMININNSRGIAVSSNNTGIITQNISVNITEIEEYYNKAVSEVEASKYNNENISEIKDMLSDILECLISHQQPGKSLLRLITKYTKEAMSIGANFGTLLTFIR